MLADCRLSNKKLFSGFSEVLGFDECAKGTQEDWVCH
jgi:hypothetical protein